MINSIEIYKGWWTRGEVANDKERVYLFGDNTHDRLVTDHIPTSTQATIRGLPNAIGIDTKKDRGVSYNSYFQNKDLAAFKIHVDEQIARAISSGKTIVIPSDGIGTGKAMLKTKAPLLFEYLTEKINQLLNKTNEG